MFVVQLCVPMLEIYTAKTIGSAKILISAVSLSSGSLRNLQMLGPLTAVPIKVPQVSSLHRLAVQAPTVLPQVCTPANTPVTHLLSAHRMTKTTLHQGSDGREVDWRNTEAVFHNHCGDVMLFLPPFNPSYDVIYAAHCSVRPKTLIPDSLPHSPSQEQQPGRPPSLQRVTAVVSPRTQGPALPTANSTAGPLQQQLANGQAEPVSTSISSAGVAYAIISASPGASVSAVNEAVKVQPLLLSADSKVIIIQPQVPSSSQNSPEPQAESPTQETTPSPSSPTKKKKEEDPEVRPLPQSGPKPAHHGNLTPAESCPSFNGACYTAPVNPPPPRCRAPKHKERVPHELLMTVPWSLSSTGPLNLSLPRPTADASGRNGRKIAFMVALGLVTTEHLEEIQSKRQERKRRSTANPAYSGLFESERKRLASNYLSNPLFLSARGTEVDTHNPPMLGALKGCRDDDVTNEDSEHEEICAICKEDGELQPCHSCTRAYHPDCLQPPLKTPPKGVWMCPKCQKKVVREEEKRRLMRRNSELKKERAVLEEQDQRLSRSLAVRPTSHLPTNARPTPLERGNLQLRGPILSAKCMDLKESLVGQQKETQASLERLKALIRLIQRDQVIQVTMTATTTTGASLLSLPWIKPTSTSTSPSAGTSALLQKSLPHTQGHN
ncbi:hypothetical protein JZ751_022282 [Albula glossodonta]|uniref:PHD-type domain-containing protein n=1 Tax=Albula glossodonta TaxID=121402 RepID=A0A8T2NUD9_9TELE|nr:hypothetical protein JZ751_022282 [Albula glossodonta]